MWREQVNEQTNQQQTTNGRNEQMTDERTNGSRQQTGKTNEPSAASWSITYPSDPSLGGIHFPKRYFGEDAAASLSAYICIYARTDTAAWALV